MYPENWPKCPNCNEPALDGHITCGAMQCDERWKRAKSYLWHDETCEFIQNELPCTCGLDALLEET